MAGVLRAIHGARFGRQLSCSLFSRARSRAPLAAAIMGTLLALAAPASSSGQAETQGRLMPGTVLARGLVAPGWIAEHLASWTHDHTAYAASCRTQEVADELHYLKKLADRDQDLRDAAQAQLMHAVVDGDSAAKRHTDVAVDAMAVIDNDMTAIDQLSAKLTALPACATATAASAAAMAAPAPAPPAPAPTPTPVAEPAHNIAPAPQAPAPEKTVAAPRTNGVFVVRFDSRPSGLTPSGIRALDAALDAASDGRKVRIAIEGCEDRDSIPDGVDCADRTHRLERMLANRGVKHPDQLIAELR